MTPTPPTPPTPQTPTPFMAPEFVAAYFQKIIPSILLLFAITGCAIANPVSSDFDPAGIHLTERVSGKESDLPKVVNCKYRPGIRADILQTDYLNCLVTEKIRKSKKPPKELLRDIGYVCDEKTCTAAYISLNRPGEKITWVAISRVSFEFGKEPLVQSAPLRAYGNSTRGGDYR